MKIIFAGTPQFAAAHLKILLDSNHVVKSILTQPDRRSGRGNKLKFSPVKDLALSHEIDVLQPISLKNKTVISALRELEADLILVVAYGLIIPSNLLNLTKLGCINIHASILPRWRGAAPMEYALFSGDRTTGISYMRMTEGLDEGPVLETQECKIESKDNLDSIENKLLSLSNRHLLDFLKKLELGGLQEKNQDETQVTFAPKIDTRFQLINWNKRSEEIERKIKSLDSKYGAYTFLGSKRIKIYQGEAVNKSTKLNPGELIISDENHLLVGCKEGTLVRLKALQMEGKSIINEQEFIRGYKSLIQEKIKFSSNVQ